MNDNLIVTHAVIEQAEPGNTDKARVTFSLHNSLAQKSQIVDREAWKGKWPERWIILYHAANLLGQKLDRQIVFALTMGDGPDPERHVAVTIPRKRVKKARSPHAKRHFRR